MAISVCVGVVLFLVVSFGLHRTALVTNTLYRLIPTCSISDSKLCPALSPWNGKCEPSAPNRPGASPMKKIGASSGPQPDPRTQTQPVIRGHFSHASTHRTKTRNRLSFALVMTVRQSLHSMHTAIVI